MSQGATEQGTQGQESGTEQEHNGSQGQESGAGGSGQESGTQGNQQSTEQQQGTDEQATDFSTIQDPAVRAHLERMDKDAREARQQAARYRTERNTARTQLTEAQRANETEAQRQERENQEAEQERTRLREENRTLKVGAALTTAATGAKAFNPATVAGLLDAKVELDDDGNPTNIDKLLKDLRKSDPYLFKRASQDGGEGNDGDGAPSGDMNDRIRGMVRKTRAPAN